MNLIFTKKCLKNRKLFLFAVHFVLFILVWSCTTKNVKIVNKHQGSLQETIQLKLNATKRFILDTMSAPKPRYIQMFNDSSDICYLSFLNEYANAIYIYNYSTTEFCDKITFNKVGADAIMNPLAYYYKNRDSIYVYDKILNGLILTNDRGKTKEKILLRGEGNESEWYKYFPQYNPETVTPFLECGEKLSITGQYFFSIPKSLIDKFKITAQINFKSNQINYIHLYPKELYGYGSNWEGGVLTIVYPEKHPDGNKLIYSFPVSHNLYIANNTSNLYKKVYAGSNYAGTISPMSGNPKKTSREKIYKFHGQQDFYTAIIYDKFRRVYYRFLLKGIKNATNHSRLNEKPINIIVMDEHFNYLGETEIGKGNDWNWHNSFVSREGLNIEYLEKDYAEVYLTFKIFTIKEI